MGAKLSTAHWMIFEAGRSLELAVELRELLVGEVRDLHERQVAHSDSPVSAT